MIEDRYYLEFDLDNINTVIDRKHPELEQEFTSYLSKEFFDDYPNYKVLYREYNFAILQRGKKQFGIGIFYLSELSIKDNKE
jgi:hypothetical protein